MKHALALGLLVFCACGGKEEVLFGQPADQDWPQPSLLPLPTGPRLAFTDNGEDTLFIADLATFTKIGKVPVGRYPLEKEGPHHLQASPDGRYLYVGISNTSPPSANSTGPHGSHGTGAEDGYLLQVDALTGRTVNEVRVGRNPGDIRFDPTGQYIWQSHFDVQAVADARAKSQGGNIDLALMDSPVIITKVPEMDKDTQVQFLICPTGHGMAFSRDGKQAYVACDESDQVAIIDVATHEVKRVNVADDAAVPPYASYQPYAIAVSPLDGRVWVSDAGSAASAINGGLRVIDPETGTMIDSAKVDTTGRALFGAFTADGSRFYVVTQGSPDQTSADHLLEVDPVTSTILRDVNLTPLGCVRAHKSRLSPDETEVWVVCEGDWPAAKNGTFEVFDRAALTAKSHLELGIYPDDVVVVPPPQGAP